MTLPYAFIDTNILLRHFLQDYPDQSPRCSILIIAIAQGEISVLITETVVFEATYMLEKRFGLVRADIAREMLEFIELPSVHLDAKRIVREAFELYVKHPGLSFADCYHAAFAMNSGIPRVFTFDRRMGTIPGIERIEP